MAPDHGSEVAAPQLGVMKTVERVTSRSVVLYLELRRACMYLTRRHQHTKGRPL